MVKVTGRTLPWAILLALVFGAIVLYFAAMLEVTGRISKEQDGLEMLSLKWLGIELELSEEVQPDSRIGSPGSLVPDFQRQLPRHPRSSLAFGAGQGLFAAPGRE